MSGFTVPVTLQLRRSNVFCRLRQLEALGMVHLKHIAVLHTLHFERRRRFCLGITFSATAARRNTEPLPEARTRLRNPCGSSDHLASYGKIQLAGRIQIRGNQI